MGLSLQNICILIVFLCVISKVIILAKIWAKSDAFKHLRNSSFCYHRLYIRLYLCGFCVRGKRLRFRNELLFQELWNIQYSKIFIWYTFIGNFYRKQPAVALQKNQSNLSLRCCKCFKISVVWACDVCDSQYSTNLVQTFS